jgi:predicted RNA polymerase sigma factor
VLVSLLTGSAEAHGLLALMLLHDSRREARLNAANELVTLDEQDRSRWDQADGFYPYHAARADLLRRTGEREAAAEAYQRALDLCGNQAELTYLRRRLDELQS